MQKPKKPEIVPGDKRLRQNLLIVIALYLLFLLWLEPMLDFMLSLVNNDPLALGNLNSRKIAVASVAYAIARSVPIALFFWLGYRIVLSASLPPGKMKFPFTVPRIKGKQAKMFGFLLMGICVALIYFEMVQLSRKLVL